MEENNRLVYPERKIWGPLASLGERMEMGKNQRLSTPREAHSAMAPSAGRADPIQLIIDSGIGRVEKLLPIRYSRMLASPFAFLRGSAIVMAEDLSHTPCSGIFVQCCGDCHLMNFGGYATPERNQIFDINDFDETLPAPFEWDVKRLAASVIVAGRYKNFTEKESRRAAYSAVQAYSDKIREFAHMRQLEIWYNRIDEATVVNMFKADADFVKRIKNIAMKARHRTHEFVFPKISEMKDGKIRIVDEPPLIYHPTDYDELMDAGRLFFDAYFNSLTEDKKSLLNRFKLDDIALKVVGVGSVGTRCLIGLFTVNNEDGLLLQFKEAKASVFEKFSGNCVYQNHGERIVNGQRLMQSASDIFLGWATGKNGNDFYVRQLRDMKSSANPENFTPRNIVEYASLCGWTLAKSHAKAGRASEITGYIGKGEIFTKAITDFAVQYADQTERDYELLKIAAKDNRIPVFHESP
jgi:uncharacterized protein (DUF2252 family)